MIMMCILFFLSSLLSTSPQHIYEKDKDDCSSNERDAGIISTLLTELRQIQHDVDQLRRENIEIKDSLKSFGGMLTSLKKTISDSKEDLTSSILKIIEDGLNAKDCNDLYTNGITKSGVYKINPSGVESKISVFCDMMVEGGGWTAIQKRVSGAVRFNRNWAEYKTGFGSPNDSYWIGNDVIHQLTRGRNSSLYVSITLTNGTKLYELYNQFSVADETNNFRLFLGGPASGTLGESMIDSGNSGEDQSGMSFSTPDRDHDRSSNNCAANHRGGWWFNMCHRAFLNGQWSSANWFYPWYTTLKYGRDIKETVMMIKAH